MPGRAGRDKPSAGIQFFNLDGPPGPQLVNGQILQRVL
jgi:hypothetical protein